MYQPFFKRHYDDLITNVFGSISEQSNCRSNPSRPNGGILQLAYITRYAQNVVNFIDQGDVQTTDRLWKIIKQTEQANSRT